ncbi:complement receptor type 1-like [Sinocyclocheilus grahami]|uniref:complement receptor type 1-like n=1 Tax=Sinocyclocheilus grahami TaxID=75366 RepID=UPI0007ACBEAC|nr:PREDICTED: complement receptor type 1-like [Sinocyclocheilus grahami]
MALVWRNILILVFAHFVVSQRRSPIRCGEPTKYPDKHLLKKYLQKVEFNDGEKVLYTCALGYEPSAGSRTSQCVHGQWTTLNMKCQKKKCNALGDIENGRYNQEGRSFGDKAIAVCNEGYILRGEGVRMCTEKGWNGMDPICEVSKIICSAPAVANRQIKPGERTQYAPQDIVNIVCSEGFDLIGLPQVTCGRDGQWQGLPVCSKVMTCSAPAVANGRIRPGSRVYKPKDSVDITCSEGFDLIGPAQVMCGPDGQWQALPECRLKRITVMTCSAPAVANGRIRPGSRVYKPKDSVDITCSEGFDLIGPAQVMCGPDGQWQALPECRLKRITVMTCSAPAVANGRIRPGSRVYKPKDSVDITCSEGFDLIGPAQVMCGPDGQWQALPECRLKRITDKCGPAPSYPHAFPRDESSTLKEYPSGARIRYKCSIGYGRVRGSINIHCQNGQWTNLQLRCERKKCGSAGEIFNGQFEYTGVSFGDSATAVCQEGYELIGPKVQICRDGGWDRRSPVCEPVHCPPPPEVKGAEMFDPIYDHVPFGHVLSYHCRTGALIGERDIFNQLMTCSAPAVANGRIRPGSRVYKPKDSVDITCSEGFDLIGPAQVMCGPDGQWQALPECRPKRITDKCGPAPSYPHAFPRDESSTLKEYPSGARIRYKCSIGYGRVRGSINIHCQNGQWTNLQLRCERKKCGSAGEIFNGQFEYTGVSFGDSATAVCQEG